MRAVGFSAGKYRPSKDNRRRHHHPKPEPRIASRRWAPRRAVAYLTAHRASGLDGRDLPHVLPSAIRTFSWWATFAPCARPWAMRWAWMLHRSEKEPDRHGRGLGALSPCRGADVLEVLRCAVMRKAPGDGAVTTPLSGPMLPPRSGGGARAVDGAAARLRRRRPRSHFARLSMGPAWPDMLFAVPPDAPAPLRQRRAGFRVVPHRFRPPRPGARGRTADGGAGARQFLIDL